jgi:urease accessory protein
MSGWPQRPPPDVIETPALQKLLAWLSPAFPIGGFAWSAGLETAIADGRANSPAALREWLEGLLRHGSLRSDAIILAHAHRASGDPAALQGLADLCLALIPARERQAETLAMGAAFVAAARAWPSDVFARLPAGCPYPVAVGAVAAGHGLPLHPVLVGVLTSAVQAQISVAVRLVPLGQTAGLAVLAGLEPVTAEVAAAAEAAPLSDLGGIAYAADIAQMRHETLEPRLFRS